VRDSYDSTSGLLSLFLQEKLVLKDLLSWDNWKAQVYAGIWKQKYVDVVNYIMFVPQSPQRT
jgi:hypothetical protein